LPSVVAGRLNARWGIISYVMFVHNHLGINFEKLLKDSSLSHKKRKWITDDLNRIKLECIKKNEIGCMTKEQLGIDYSEFQLCTKHILPLSRS